MLVKFALAITTDHRNFKPLLISCFPHSTMSWVKNCIVVKNFYPQVLLQLKFSFLLVTLPKMKCKPRVWKFEVSGNLNLSTLLYYYVVCGDNVKCWSGVIKCTEVIQLWIWGSFWLMRNSVPVHVFLWSSLSTQLYFVTKKPDLDLWVDNRELSLLTYIKHAWCSYFYRDKIMSCCKTTK